ncbi:N-acyl homoserine lactonase family protein [Microbacterium sp. RD1]|uniref:N-acyl homoserine lactonase family protein n=1 Tax=Microbacterium sp. RD1 TaxID=3457313 RepID=UPI003FA55F1E
MSESADDRYEVVIVRYGTRSTVRSEVYLNYPLYGEDDAPIEMDYFIWVVRNAVRTILVDTGFSPRGGERRGRATLIAPPDAWRALGVTPEQAPLIVLTHAHYDHVGNITHFPDSTIVTAARELDFWSGPHAHHPLFSHSVEDDELDALRAAVGDGRVETFTGSRTVAPGVEVIEIGGHTPGQSVVRVQTTEGPVLLASDAVHYYEELDRAMPFTSVADLVAMYEGFDRIRALVAAGDVRHVVAGHDPATLERFAALGEPLPRLAAVIGRIGSAS